MKKIILFVPIIVLLALACKKSLSSTTDIIIPQAPTVALTKAQYNHTSFGVYKGVVIGSSGTIVFRINNGDTIVKGFLDIDDTHDTLVTTQSLTAGQPIINVDFTGKISSMTLSANADGSYAQLTNIRINGHHNVTGFIVHENSDKQVFCYEGTFDGHKSGIINATRVGVNEGDTTYVLMKVTSSNDTTLYGGYGIAVQDTTNVNVYMPGVPDFSYFQVGGVFHTNSDSTQVFGGTLSGYYYGNGAFTAKRTY